MTDHLSLADENYVNFRQFSVNWRKEGRKSQIEGPLVPVHRRPLQPYVHRLLGLSYFPGTFLFHCISPLPVYLVVFHILMICDEQGPDSKIGGNSGGSKPRVRDDQSLHSSENNGRNVNKENHILNYGLPT